MKKWKLPVFCLFIVGCIALNWYGDQFCSRISGPLWLDSVGTVLCAYLFGPVCGMLVGVTANLISTLLYGVSWAYALVSVLIAFLAGKAGKQKLLDTLYGTLCTSAVMGLGSTVLAVILNNLFNGGSTGNVWGDAVTGFMMELGLPEIVGMAFGQLEVELLDKLVILLVLYVILKILRATGLRRSPAKKQAPDKDAGQAAVKTAALLLAAGLAASSLSGVSGTRAEEAGTTPGTDYSGYVQSVYASTNGLPCGEANDIAQTKDGILWIGTYAGLYRYNGREFRWMDEFDSVRNVNCLYVDEEGRLWIGTNDNGLTIAINGQVANVLDQSGGLPSNSVRSVIRSSDGYYYIGTTASMQVLTLYYGMRKLNTLSEIIFADDTAADARGHVAAVTNTDGKLFLLQRGQILSSRQVTSGKGMFKSCTFTPEGLLLAATTENEIYVFDVADGWFNQRDVITCQGLRTIKDLTYLESGELMICADNGIGYIDLQDVFHLVNTGDFNNSIDNMLMDYQGNLWFTSSRLGLLRLAASDFRDIYGTAGMERQVVNAVAFWNGICYIGTDGGLDAVDATGHYPVHNHLTDHMKGRRIRCLMVDSHNHLWICTHLKGVVEVAPNGVEYVYDHEQGHVGNKARLALELKDGSVLLGTNEGVQFIRDHEVAASIPYAVGGIQSLVLTASEMADGRIFVGTDGNGLAKLENGEIVKMMTRADGLSSEVILRTVVDESCDGLFIVTSNGLCYMDAEENIRQLTNFPYYNCYDIWPREDGQLFVMSSAGLYLVDREALLAGTEKLPYELLDSRRGLTSSLTANSWHWYDAQGQELYLPCDNGVYVIHTRNYSSGAKLYRLSVPTIRLDGVARRTVQSETFVIGRGVARVEMLPEIINYTIQEPYIAYKLDGFDTEWTVAPQGSLGSIAYTNLHAGSYLFHLGVLDGNREKLVAERTYAIVKEEELYDKPWFIVYVLIVPLFTVGWVTWTFVKRRQDRLQKELAAANRQVEMGKQTVVAIAKAVDAKDVRTSEHSKRVAEYSRKIAEAFGLDRKQCQDIEWTAQMHDIGKIGVRDAVLNKAGRLTDQEYAEMKGHTTKGAEILKDFTLLDNVIEGAEFHHERYDGRGYPKGLKGEEIPLFARIIGVADAFDAMTANRVYRKQLDFGYVLGELEKGKGTQFDPQFVDILLRLIREKKIDLSRMYGVSAEELAANNRPAKSEEEARAAAEAEAKAAVKAEAKAAVETEAKAAQKPAEKGDGA